MNKPETPMMTAKEIREFIKSEPALPEATDLLEEMKSWYFANLHLITIGEEHAFKKEINNLYLYTVLISGS